MKTVTIACKTKDAIDIAQLRDLQGNLKEISKEDLDDLKHEIVTTGFAFPVMAWADPKKKVFIIGGHQRVRALKELKENGYTDKAGKHHDVKVPNVPVVYITAASAKDARRRVLQDASVYGKVQEKGVFDFMKTADLDFDSIGSFRLPEFNIEQFQYDYFPKTISSDAPAPLRFRTEFVEISSLTPHPENYRVHGKDQMAHIVQSIKDNGFYKNVVVALDSTILAGHGAVEAAKSLGIKKIPVVRLNLGSSDVRAKKILTGDNETSKLGEVDDRKLSDILREIATDSEGLIGTGFDEKMLANLVMVTRHASEIGDINEANEWIGLPAMENVPQPHKIVISFENEEYRNQFLKLIKMKELSKASGKTLSMWWPQRERDDVQSIGFKEK